MTMSESFMFLNPYTTFVGAPESVQLFVGIMFGIVALVGIVLFVVEKIYDWKEKRKGKNDD